jgi:hypothetical protein
MTDTPASRPAALPLGILAGIFILFFAVNPQIVADWRIYSFDDGTYSHAYLIPFMCAYLAWVGWKAGHLTPRGSWLFLGLARPGAAAVPVAGYRPPALPVARPGAGLPGAGDAGGVYSTARASPRAGSSGS